MIAPKFLRVHPFSDDLAAAMIVDEFGEGKWGFIDRTGAWVISPRFTNEPGDFHHGRARVRPRDEVLDQFIDRKGEVVVKLGSDPASNGYANGVLVAVVENGQTYSLIDSTGSARPFPNEGAVDGRTFQFDVSQDSDRPEGFVVSRLKNGLADLNGVLIIPPMFDSNFRFDTVSGLALASFTSSDGKRIEGYIDRTGRFALIKGAESKW